MEASLQFPLGFKPVGEILAVPSDRMAAKSLLFRKSADRGQREQKPSVAAGEARHVMRAQEQVQRREGFVYPLGEENPRRNSSRRDKRPWNGVGRAHGFGCSCAVPVVQGRVVTQGK